MYKKSITLLALLLVFTIGCTPDTDENTQDNTENMNTQPMQYETEKERRQRLNIEDKSIGELGGYPQTQQNGLNESDDETTRFSDEYTNEDSTEISRHLKSRKDIKQAQVAITDDRVIVAVMLDEYVGDDITKTIERDVRKIVSDKEIIIYTDDIYWDHRRNDDARDGQRNIGEGIEKGLERFFNMDD
ncbi:YhcN/YlaJ family sporulation lipoprotein [Virgibacillus byunsanensis]|uniref:YhcN/YlaJ family sporulation lipoprotein n=1 Tax=Virgibacillus byunsanensis TaxID=570945 RepID=A0ABW3LMY0_9BACI